MGRVVSGTRDHVTGALDVQWTRRFSLLLALFGLNFAVGKDWEKKNLLKSGYGISRSIIFKYIRDCYLRAKHGHEQIEERLDQALIVSRISLFYQF